MKRRAAMPRYGFDEDLAVASPVGKGYFFDHP